MTNFDRIKGLTVEQMAMLIDAIDTTKINFTKMFDCENCKGERNCRLCFLKWLKSEDYYVAFDKAINHIKAWDKFKEKINQLQTYKLFQNDKETYLNKQDIIDLVLEIEREVNNE